MINLNDTLLESGFEIYKTKNAYNVYTKETFWFLISDLSELTLDRIESEKISYQNRLKEAEEWEKDYWEKIKSLPKYQKIYFTADIHQGHKGILKHSPNRGFSEDEVIQHDEWIIDIWNKIIHKKDIIYVLGDFIWFGPQLAQKFLGKINGLKHIVFGNHDATCRKLTNYFESNADLKTVRFKKEVYPFIEEFEFVCSLSHYPMASWDQKSRWSVNLHGHVHSKMDDFNKKTTDMRWDVGWDGELGYHQPVSLEKIYCEYKKKRIIVGDIINNR